MDGEHDVGVAGVDDEKHLYAAVAGPVAEVARMTDPDIEG